MVASLMSRVKLGIVAAAALIVTGTAFAQTPITLIGASQYNDDHSYTKALARFGDLVKQYYGKPVNIVLHKNGELGVDNDIITYMNQGISVDYALVSPSQMARYAKAAPLVDVPFLFRDVEHWNKVIEQDVMKPIADEVAQKADILWIGYGGGGVRNIFATKPLQTIKDLKGLKIRVQGAPIWSKSFIAIGMAPTVIAYNENYSAIQSGVIDAGENASGGIDQMKFYEVAPYLSLTKHAIETRPLSFAGKTFRKLPPDLQAAVLRAGKEAAAYGRQLETGDDTGKIERLAKEGRLKIVQFTERPEIERLAAPVIADYAKELGAEAVLAKIKAVK